MNIRTTQQALEPLEMIEGQVGWIYDLISEFSNAAYNFFFFYHFLNSPIFNSPKTKFT